MSDTCAGRRGVYLFDANQSGAIEFRSFVGCCYWVPPVTLAEICPTASSVTQATPSPVPSLIVIFSCLIVRFVCRMISGIQRKPHNHPLLPWLKLPRPFGVPSHARSSFRNFLREELGENNDDEEMQDMINQADGDGEISHNEEEGQLP